MKNTDYEEGFFIETWDDYSYDDETDTITILTRNREDNVIRRITRHYITVATE